MNSKVRTVPKTQSQSKDKDKVQQQNKMAKLNIIKSESFTQFKILLEDLWLSEQSVVGVMVKQK